MLPGAETVPEAAAAGPGSSKGARWPQAESIHAIDVPRAKVKTIRVSRLGGRTTLSRRLMAQ